MGKGRNYRGSDCNGILINSVWHVNSEYDLRHRKKIGCCEQIFLLRLTAELEKVAK